MIRVCSACGAENRVPPERLAQTAKCGRCKQQLSPESHPVNVESARDFEELVQRSALPVLVDFWAPWCGPCRTVAPELDQLAQSRAGRVLIAKLNTEALPDVAQSFGIRSIPTMIRFDKGRETKRVSGAMRAPQIAQAFAL